VKAPGEHLARWDGRNYSGERVTSGVYFYNIEAGNFSATRKMPGTIGIDSLEVSG
jgi:hypothetical protein